MKINTHGTHKECQEKNIHYTITNGSFVYTCLTCDKQIDKNEITTKVISPITARQKAERIENDLKKYAGVVRNLILEGETLDKALKNERATFWLDSAKETDKRETKAE